MRLDEQTRQQIVERYMAGERIDVIERELGVTRSSIYYALERADVAPSRVKQTRRLRGDQVDLKPLYALITAQEERIAQLEELLTKAGIDIPDLDE